MKSFQDILNSVIDGSDEDLAQTSKDLQTQAAERSVVYTDLGLRSGLTRIRALHEGLTKVEDAIWSRIDSMTTDQLMRFHHALSEQLDRSTKRLLPESDGRPAPIQILTMINQASGLNGANQGHATVPTIDQAGRERIRSMVRLALTPPEEPRLKVVKEGR